MEFENLSTARFQRKLRPAAIRIYQRIFPECRVEDLREKGIRVHVLDQEFGIDSLIHLERGQWISIQEKYRKNDLLTCEKRMVRPPVPDFTQEYMNAFGTDYESPGEWFKLGAQLYFYGWSNEAETDFQKWVILDIAKYKIIVEEAGGLKRLGRLYINHRHGRASFFAIPMTRLKDAFLFTSKTHPEKILT